MPVWHVVAAPFAGDLDANVASPNGKKYSCAEYFDMKACDHPAAGPYIRSICQKTCGACSQQCGVQPAMNVTTAAEPTEPGTPCDADDDDCEDDDAAGSFGLSAVRSVGKTVVSVATKIDLAGE